MNKDVTKWSKINSILSQIATTKRSYTKSVLFIDNYAFVQVIFNIGIFAIAINLCFSKVCCENSFPQPPSPTSSNSCYCNTVPSKI